MFFLKLDTKIFEIRTKLDYLEVSQFLKTKFLKT
jgi:hypothetical protein